ncbi:TonB-dependent receptor [Chitinophaga pendula]|uniref:TonB-dependent receptor n=1 Tax=Chitinophaga TaxID=79328 RepID=UPI0018DF0C7C|nr:MULTISPECIES: TonB-dependent receptor [Chitinophaga]UCJ04784.1 TonB-dependent receptor [Chitinophaga pendula]
MMRWTPLYFLLFFTWLSKDAHAQTNVQGTITGHIIQQGTTANIEGATIFLKKQKDTLFYRTTISDKTGNFSFVGLDSGEYGLEVSHLVFKKYSAPPITIDQYHRIVELPVIALEISDNRNLKEVVVQSEQKPLVEQQLDRQVVNVNTLIANAGANALDILGNSPGISVSEEGGISLRGRAGVKIFVDDRPAHISGKDLSNYLKSFPAGTIDKIEIMPNPPAKYDASGTAGIINIRTKKIKTKGFNSNLTLSYGQGSYARTNNSLNFNYRNNKVNIYGNASYSVLNNYFDSYRDRKYDYPGGIDNYTLAQHYYEASSKKSTNYKIGIDYDIRPQTSIGIAYSGFYSPYKERGSYKNVFSQVPGTPDSTMYVKSNLTDNARNNAVSLYLRNQFDNPEQELNLSLDYLDFKDKTNQLSENDTYLSNNTFDNRYVLISNTPFTAKIYSARTDYDSRIWGDIKMSAGAQITYSRRNSEGIYFNKRGEEIVPNESLNNRFEYKENINAFYLSLRRELNRVSIQAGLRVENTYGRASRYDFVNKRDSSFRLNYTDLFPTLFVSYKLDSIHDQQLTFSAGRRITRPTYQDLNPSIFFYDRYTSITGNPVLQPEYSSNVELAYSYGDKIRLGLVYNLTQDNITQVYEQVDKAFIGGTVNIDKVRGIGINANGTVPLYKWWTINLYGELMNTYYKGAFFKDGYLDRDLTTVRMTGSSQFRFNKGWGMELSGFYRSSMILGPAILQPVWQVHFATQKKILGDNGMISLTVRDIFKSWNVKRTIEITHANVSFSNTFDTRLVNLTFTYKFGKMGSSRVRKTGIQSEESRIGGK